MYNKNSGYLGWSMSVRAAEAYADGEMPISRWTKANILNAIADYADDSEIDLSGIPIEKLTLAELKENFLVYASWHHTGKFCQRTDFYKIDGSVIDEITAEYVEGIIKDRPPRNKKN